MEIEIRPWNRQPDENEEPYEAFLIYRDMPMPRALRAVADQLGKQYSLISRWKRLHRWDERVRLYDAFMLTSTDDGKIAVLNAIQNTVLQEAALDYRSLRALWERELHRLEVAQVGDDTVTSLHALIRARDSLDRFARRTARMPVTYKQTDSADEDDNAQWILSPETGPQKLLTDPQ